MTREELMEKIEAFLDDRRTEDGFVREWQSLEYKETWDAEALFNDILTYKYGEDIDGDCVMRTRCWNQKLDEWVNLPQPRIQDDMSATDLIRLTESRARRLKEAELQVTNSLYALKERLREKGIE